VALAACRARGEGDVKSFEDTFDPTDADASMQLAYAAMELVKYASMAVD
jgi:hypothetical protein